MSKEEFRRMALYGNTLRERKIGAGLTRLFDMQAKSGIEQKEFNLFISPFPIDELNTLAKSRNDALTPFAEASKKFEESHSELYDSDISAYMELFDLEIKPKFEENLNTSSHVSNLIYNKKQEIFYDLTHRLERIMKRLRGLSILEMNLDNYHLVKELQDKHKEINDPKFDKLLDDYFDKLEDLADRHSQNPYDDEVLKNLENLENYVHSEIRESFSKIYNMSPKLQFDLFSGEINSSYFNGFEDFMKDFEHYAFPKPPESPYFHSDRRYVGFELHGGMLDGDYLISCSYQKNNFENVNLDYDGTKATMNLFGPVRFKMKLSDRYSDIIQTEFDQITKDYNVLFVNPAELRPWIEINDSRKI